MEPLRQLDITRKPLFTACLPNSRGVLDDHFEGWFLSFPDASAAAAWSSEGLESVLDLTNDTAWLAPPDAATRRAQVAAPGGVA